MTTSAPLSVSDLIFANTGTSDFNKILGDIKRSALSIHNRLRSIEQDASFAAAVATAYQLPLVANERCGSWYVPPGRKAGSAYFKSTDGHMSQWSFSLRRLNLQVLDVVAEKGGCIVVDSTRRGKSMPDALSKTVPIWICVLNRYLFPSLPACHVLSTPPNVIGPSEHAQIDDRIAGFVQQLQSLHLDLASLKAKLIKPLRPLWVTPDSALPPETPEFPDFYPVVLCTASRRVAGGEASQGGYIQGAADDSEAWAHGLTAPLFWSHRDELLATSEGELPGRIAELVTQSGETGLVMCTLVKPTLSVFLGTVEGVEAMVRKNDVVVTIGPSPSAQLTKGSNGAYLHLTCAAGKVGSRQLRHELPKLLQYLQGRLQTLVEVEARILVACETGKDHSVGTTLAILCLFVDDNGRLKPASTAAGEVPPGLSKNIIKQRLSWISVSQPDANPTRTTLQSVNAFLLG
ncbi:hypothetical protein MBLNU459_g5336t1 [Dothideomycetes sp. NU459]